MVDAQTFSFAPLLVIGGFLKLSLYGKIGIQPNDEKYYTVFNSIKCFGIPSILLSPTAPLFYESVTELSLKMNVEESDEFKPFMLARADLKKTTALIDSAISVGRFKDAARIIASQNIHEGLRKREFLIWFEGVALEQGETGIMMFYLMQIFKNRSDFTPYEAVQFGIVPF
jgi:hypothetical protein